ncbi:MAG: hypothetical protein Q9180_006304, partial [Flavoplaca navasiana]
MCGVLLDRNFQFRKLRIMFPVPTWEILDEYNNKEPHGSTDRWDELLGSSDPDRSSEAFLNKAYQDSIPIPDDERDHINQPYYPSTS